MRMFSQQSVATIGLVWLVTFHTTAWAQGGEPRGEGQTTAASPEDWKPSRAGLVSLGLSFGAQSGPYGRESAGFRYGWLEDLWTGLFLQLSINEKTQQQAIGAHLECGLDVFKRGRTALSLVPVFAYGQSTNSETKETQTQWGASAGMTLEVFLLREVSTALKIDVGGQFAPAQDMRFSTASSELLLFYHL